MTRKDYEKVAKAIAKGQDIVDLTYDLIRIFEEENPRFDRVRFLEACGFLTYKD